MVRFVKIDRKSFFEGWTPGLVLGVLLFVTLVLTAYMIESRTGHGLTLCPLRTATGFPCPLCGGTTSAMKWLAASPREAWESNPLVAVGLPLFGIWVVMRLGFGREISIALPRPFLAAGTVFLIALNWIYVLSRK